MTSKTLDASHGKGIPATAENFVLPKWSKEEIDKKLEECSKLLKNWEEHMNKTDKMSKEQLLASTDDLGRHVNLKRKLHDTLGIMARMVQNQVKQKKPNEPSSVQYGANAVPTINASANPRANGGAVPATHGQGYPSVQQGRNPPYQQIPGQPGYQMPYNPQQMSYHQGQMYPNQPATGFPSNGVPTYNTAPNSVGGFIRVQNNPVAVPAASVYPRGPVGDNAGPMSSQQPAGIIPNAQQPTSVGRPPYNMQGVPPTGYFMNYPPYPDNNQSYQKTSADGSGNYYPPPGVQMYHSQFTPTAGGQPNPGNKSAIPSGPPTGAQEAGSMPSSGQQGFYYGQSYGYGQPPPNFAYQQQLMKGFPAGNVSTQQTNSGQAPSQAQHSGQGQGHLMPGQSMPGMNPAAAYAVHQQMPQGQQYPPMGMHGSNASQAAGMQSHPQSVPSNAAMGQNYGYHPVAPGYPVYRPASSAATSSTEGPASQPSSDSQPSGSSGSTR